MKWLARVEKNSRTRQDCSHRGSSTDNKFQFVMWSSAMFYSLLCCVCTCYMLMIWYSVCIWPKVDLNWEIRYSHTATFKMRQVHIGHKSACDVPTSKKLFNEGVIKMLFAVSRWWKLRVGKAKPVEKLDPQALYTVLVTKWFSFTGCAWLIGFSRAFPLSASSHVQRHTCIVYWN